MVATAVRGVKSVGVGPLVAGAVALAVFWIAFDGGSYGLESRATLAIVVWWTILITVVLGLWPLARPGRAAFVTAGFLTALGMVTAASVFWASSAERAFTEANRVALFLGVFAVAVLAGTRGNVRRWSDGLAVGIVALGLLALAARCFPDVFPGGQVAEFLPAARGRQSWPMEYWNGLAIFVALAFPLLLRTATSAERLLTRSLAVGVIPALVAAMSVTSSRGGFASGIVAVVAYVLLTPRRVAALCALAVALGGAGVAVAAFVSRDELFNDPFAAAAVGQGRAAAAITLLVCVAAGGVWALGTRLLADRVAVTSAMERIAVLALVVLLVAGIVLSHPVRRFDTFSAMPEVAVAAEDGNDDDFVRAHLTSWSGSGRWQFWTAAVDEWETRPIEGRGAGSYEAWWAEEGVFIYFLRDAHSLYLETLGELGILGFVLLAGALGTGLVAGVCRLGRSAGDERVLIAALLASFLAWLLAVGIDWMWEETVVAVVGFVLLGLLTGPATAGTGPRTEGRTTRRRFTTGVLALLVVWSLIFAQAVPLLAHVKIAASQDAVDRGDAAAALGNAENARTLQPWAASPYVQLALVREALDDLPGAHDAILDAIERDPNDWRLWRIRTRIETLSGDIAAARESLARTRELGRNVPLIANVP
jgi:hypothetical protein